MLQATLPRSICWRYSHSSLPYSDLYNFLHGPAFLVLSWPLSCTFYNKARTLWYTHGNCGLCPPARISVQHKLNILSFLRIIPSWYHLHVSTYTSSIEILNRTCCLVLNLKKLVVVYTWYIYWGKNKCRLTSDDSNEECHEIVIFVLW